MSTWGVKAEIRATFYYVIFRLKWNLIVVMLLLYIMFINA